MLKTKNRLVWPAGRLADSIISSAIAEGPRDASCQLKSCQNLAKLNSPNCRLSCDVLVAFCGIDNMKCKLLYMPCSSYEVGMTVSD